jgi:hypothetical protein
MELAERDNPFQAMMMWNLSFPSYPQLSLIPYQLILRQSEGMREIWKKITLMTDVGLSFICPSA